MDTIKDLLKDKTPQEPPQLSALKEYAKTKHRVDIKASVSYYGYTIVVPSAPLASTLQMELPKIIEQCNLDKKLFIRIGVV